MSTPKHAWCDACAAKFRLGHYDAHDGRGWQPQSGQVSPVLTAERDAEAKAAQRDHRMWTARQEHEHAAMLEEGGP
jgi:hypothetical protein